MNFEQTGKVREFYQKYWENEEILINFYFFCDFLIEVYLLKWDHSDLYSLIYEHFKINDSASICVSNLPVSVRFQVLQ